MGFLRSTKWPKNLATDEVPFSRFLGTLTPGRAAWRAGTCASEETQDCAGGSSHSIVHRPRGCHARARARYPRPRVFLFFRSHYRKAAAAAAFHLGARCLAHPASQPAVFTTSPPPPLHPTCPSLKGKKSFPPYTCSSIASLSVFLSALWCLAHI